MQKQPSQKLPKILIASLIVGVVFLAGISIGKNHQAATLGNRVLAGENSPTERDLSLLWDVWRTLDKKYPFKEKPKAEEQIWYAAEGLAQSYNDPYTVFFPPKEAKSFGEDVAGEFGGVGMEVGMRDGFITVIAPLKDSPAEKAGVRAGDKVLQVGDIITIDLSLDEAIQYIRGELGTDVTLLVSRDGEEEPLNITITRDTIQVPTIETEIIENDIFLLSLFNFSEHSSELFQDAILEFKESRLKKLIVDVRGNPGGFLSDAIEISSWFLPEGKVVVRESLGEDQEGVVYRSRGFGSWDKDIKMIILVDGGSASASEILAGALSEHGIADLVGTQTFGKGSVQELIDLPGGSSLKVTVAEWLTPKGVSISKEGLTPKYEVTISREDFEAEEDPQLDRAIELLKK